jgi:hypothetical protein
MFVYLLFKRGFVGFVLFTNQPDRFLIRMSGSDQKLCARVLLLSVIDTASFKILQGMTNTIKNFSGLCFSTDPKCCHRNKLSTPDLEENTISEFVRFLIDYDIATTDEENRDATEPNAKKQRRAALSHVIRFDHLKRILILLGANATVDDKFGKWRAGLLLDPTCDIHPVTYLTAFLTSTPGLENVDCANVSLCKSLDTDSLCDQILALDQFSWEERRSCASPFHDSSHKT